MQVYINIIIAISFIAAFIITIKYPWGGCIIGLIQVFIIGVILTFGIAIGIPIALIGLVTVFAIGCVVGLLVGVFYGIKNYWLSIYENINNKMLKYAMIVITSLVIAVFIFFITTVTYYLISYYI